MSESSFFSRWSKRKAGLEPDEAAPTEVATNAPVEARVPATSEIGKKARQPDGAPGPTADVDGVAAPNTTPLPDIETLNGASDFSPFMAKNVPAEARNQAMKKLFADPHYNVMDGLDIYIDDYGKPDPLPAGWLELMNQSKALRLFETPAEEAARLSGQTNSKVAVAPASNPTITEAPENPTPEVGAGDSEPATNAVSGQTP